MATDSAKQTSKSTRSILVLLAGIGALASLIAVIVFLVGPTPKASTDHRTPEEKLEFVIRQVTILCLSGETTSTQKRININLKNTITTGAAGETATEDSTKSVDAALAGVNLVTDRDTTRKCMIENVDKYFTRLTAVPSAEPTPTSPQTNTAADTGPSQLALAARTLAPPMGYISYRVQNGLSRSVAMVSPFDGGLAVPFKDVPVGKILIANAQKNVRTRPYETSVGVILPSGSCFRVVDGDRVEDETPTTTNSGGWLPVEALDRCPRRISKPLAAPAREATTRPTPSRSPIVQPVASAPAKVVICTMPGVNSGTQSQICSGNR